MREVWHMVAGPEKGEGNAARFVILLRAVNVGGHGRMAMADLRSALAGPFSSVRTYIQSGNAVVEAPPGADVAALARRAIAARFGRAPDMAVLDARAIHGILADCPFPGGDPSRTVALLHGAGRPDAALLDALARGGERWAHRPGALWLACPDGLGRSRLAAGAEAALAGAATARNLRTLRALAEMAAAR